MTHLSNTIIDNFTEKWQVDLPLSAGLKFARATNSCPSVTQCIKLKQLSFPPLQHISPLSQLTFMLMWNNSYMHAFNEFNGYTYQWQQVIVQLLLLLYYVIIHKHTHTHTPIYWPFIREYPGEPVPERYKKLSYCRVTARCVLLAVILPVAMQQCRNYLYDKSWRNWWYEVRGLVGGNVSWTMCTQPWRDWVGSHCLRCHKQTNDGQIVYITCIPTTCCREIF